MEKIPQEISRQNETEDEREFSLVFEANKEVCAYARRAADRADELSEDALQQLPSIETGKREEIVLARRAFKESVGRYLQLAVLSGIAMLTPAHGMRASEDPHEIRERAKIELKQRGITTEQRATYVPGINELVFRGVTPRGYFPMEKLKKFIPNLFSERTKDSLMREDAWLLYLGFPQEHGTFSVSDYTPKESASGYCYKMDGWFDRFMSRQPFRTPGQFIKDLSEKGGKSVEIDGAQEGDLMGHYTLGIGHDAQGSFLYYHDYWDLNIPLEEGQLLGKALTIYDRLYFDSATFEPLQELHIERGQTSEAM